MIQTFKVRVHHKLYWRLRLLEMLLDQSKRRWKTTWETSLTREPLIVARTRPVPRHQIRSLHHWNQCSHLLLTREICHISHKSREIHSSPIKSRSWAQDQQSITQRGHQKTSCKAVTTPNLEQMQPEIVWFREMPKALHSPTLQVWRAPLQISISRTTALLSKKIQSCNKSVPASVPQNRKWATLSILQSWESSWTKSQKSKRPILGLEAMTPRYKTSLKSSITSWVPDTIWSHSALEPLDSVTNSHK